MELTIAEDDIITARNAPVAAGPGTYRRAEAARVLRSGNSVAHRWTGPHCARSTLGRMASREPPDVKGKPEA